MGGPPLGGVAREQRPTAAGSAVTAAEGARAAAGFRFSRFNGLADSRAPAAQERPAAGATGLILTKPLGTGHPCWPPTDAPISRAAARWGRRRGSFAADDASSSRRGLAALPHAARRAAPPAPMSTGFGLLLGPSGRRMDETLSCRRRRSISAALPAARRRHSRTVRRSASSGFACRPDNLPACAARPIANVDAAARPIPPYPLACSIPRPPAALAGRHPGRTPRRGPASAALARARLRARPPIIGEGPRPPAPGRRSNRSPFESEPPRGSPPGMDEGEDRP